MRRSYYNLPQRELNLAYLPITDTHDDVDAIREEWGLPESDAKWGMKEKMHEAGATSVVVPVGLCGARPAGGVEYFGAPLGGPGTFGDQVWGYVGPKRRLAGTGQLPFHHMVRVRTKGIPRSMMVTWLGSNSSYQAMDSFGSMMAATLPKLSKEWDYIYKRSYAKLKTPYLDQTATHKANTREAALLVERKCYEDALDQMRIADLGALLVEWKEIMDMGRNFNDLTFKSFGRLLGKHNILSPKGVIDLLEEVSTLWLTYSYGIAPLVGTLTDLALNLGRNADVNSHLVTIKQSADGPLMKVRKTVLSSTMQATNPVIYGPPNFQTCYFGGGYVGGGANEVHHWPSIGEAVTIASGATGRDFYDLTVDIGYKLKNQYLLSTSPNFGLWQFGLTNYRGMLWEYSRFSFILDWSQRFGDFLRSVDDEANITIVGSQTTAELLYQTSGIGAGSGTAVYRSIKGVTGTGGIPSQVIFADDTTPLYYPPAIKAGTGVSEWNERAANAGSLLVLLSSALLKGRGFLRGDTILSKRDYARLKKALSILD